MTQSEEFADVCEQLGSEMSVDVYYLVPSDESRFEPLTVASSVAGLMVGAFAAGLLKGATDRASAAGAELANWLADRLAALLGRDPEERVPAPEENEEVPELLAQLREVASGLDAQELDELAQQVQGALADELSRSMPEETAARDAQRVRDATLHLLAR